MSHNQYQTEYNQIQHELLVTLEKLVHRGFNKEVIASVLADLHISHPDRGLDWSNDFNIEPPPLSESPEAMPMRRRDHIDPRMLNPVRTS